MVFTPLHYEKKEAGRVEGGFTVKGRRISFFFYNVFLPYILILMGLISLIVIVVIPLFIYSPTSSLAAITPVAEITLVDKITGFAPFEFSEFETADPLTIISREEEPIPEKFFLSVPKLGIERAEVETNSTNLDPKSSLGHYNKTALPGEVGNTFIYGHSVLPAFFRPKDYKTIFSTIHTLDKGDIFELEYNGKIYTYEIEGRVVQKPDEVVIYDPNPKYKYASYATLFTCTPPGLKTNRLSVVGRLVDEEPL